MALDLDTLLEGSPAYGVLDARDGVVLFRRSGHEREFEALAAETMKASGAEYEAIALENEDAECDRLFIAPLSEHRSFDRSD
ncbi:hypothetical protein [Brevundimonas sp.]|uniref:hypothetical protein n=1 Tax=Brevundimonas sp. TaxID=1871086 RepID=UPI00391DE15C